MLSFSKYQKWFLITACISIGLIGIINTPLFDEDEGFFAEASRNMLQSGNYVTLSVNGEQRYDKPALFFWATAFSLKTFGINELGARFPSFLFFILTLVSLYLFCVKHYSKRTGILSVVIATSILQFQVLSRAAVSDNLLNLAVALALFSFYDFLQKPKNLTLFRLYTFAGLGFLCKGPVAFVIIFGVIFLYLVLSRNYQKISKILNPLFILWALFIPLPWFYLAFQQSGDFLFTDFFIKHNLGRFTNTMESHGGVYWYYIPVIFISFIPFSHLLITSFRAWDKKNLFLIIWFVLPFVLFSFSKTQLPHYISIGYLPLIILVSQANNLNFNAVFLQIAFMLLLLTIAPYGIKYIQIKDGFIVEMLKAIPGTFDHTYLIFMILLLFLAILLFSLNSKNLIYTLLLYVVGTTLFIHKFAILQQGFVKETGIKLKSSKNHVFMVDHYNPSLSFYAQRVFTIKKDFEKGEMFFSKNSIEIGDSLISKGNGYILVVK